MDRIERLHVRDVGPFLEFEMEFPEKPAFSKKAELHLLTGENGTGKTTLLYVLASLMTPIEQSKARTRFRHANAGWTTTVGGKTYQTDEHTFPDEKATTWAAFAYSGSRQIEGVQIAAIQEPKESPFANALAFSHGDFSKVAQWVANTKSESDHYKANGDLQKADRVISPTRQIEKLVGDGVGRKIEFILRYPVSVFLRKDGEDVPFDVLPEGLKSILSWLGDLLMRLDRIPWEGDVPLLERPFYLFLDEIEVHLHPAWQRKVLPAVQALFPNAQMFVTTHSPFVVNSVSEGWVHRLALNGDGTARFDRSFPARPGQSVELILDEVFGVPQRFDAETEKKIDELRLRREEVLSSGGACSMDEWRRLIRELSGLGEETSAIASFEERQVDRILAKKNGGGSGQESRA